MKRDEIIPQDMMATLEALLAARGAEHPTFRRMVGWYRTVTDELGCRDTYEQLLAALLSAPSCAAA